MQVIPPGLKAAIRRLLCAAPRPQRSRLDLSQCIGGRIANRRLAVIQSHSQGRKALAALGTISPSVSAANLRMSVLRTSSKP